MRCGDIMGVNEVHSRITSPCCGAGDCAAGGRLEFPVRSFDFPRCAWHAARVSQGPGNGATRGAPAYDCAHRHDGGSTEAAAILARADVDLYGWPARADA